jgi:hypothetical protein
VESCLNMLCGHVHGSCCSPEKKKADLKTDSGLIVISVGLCILYGAHNGHRHRC